MRKLAVLGVLIVLGLSLAILEQHTPGQSSAAELISASQNLAQNLIPCEGPECQACHFVQLGQNLITFLIQISAAIGALMIAVAGFTMATAGGNPGKVSKGKEMMTNVVIGFVILLASWLVVDTILRLFVGDDKLGRPWNEIPCGEVIEYTNTATGIAGDVLTELDVDPNTPDGPLVRSGNCALIPSGTCTVENLTNYFGSEASNASRVCNAESGGNPGSVSKVDRLRNDSQKRPFSIGLFQINLTVHELVGCGNTTLDCKSAFEGTSYSARIVNERLYNQCTVAAMDATCNIRNAARIHERSSWQSTWGGAKACNIR